jgi:hypothetical protein
METSKEQLTKTLIIASIMSAIGVIAIIFFHNMSFQKNSTIVLPAGGTYLGSTPGTTIPTPLTTIQTSDSKNGMVTIKGRIYPYTFEAPDSLKFVTFPNDPYDIYALVIDNKPADQNVLIGVDDLKKTQELKTYITGDKRVYVENWWKQFGGLTGVSTITPFTNSQGLKGYRAVFINSSGQTPTVDVFFETPNPEHVIHLANGPLPKTTFEAIVDSVAWEKK